METITITKDIPLMGTIMFGIIDRGSNLIQIRPTTVCNLKCSFCSTSANEHPVNYEVELNHLITEVKEIVKQKACNNIEANIDSVGEPTCYPKLVELIKELKKIKEISFISMQTNGTLLTDKKIKDLEKAGLNRINLSIHTLDENKSKELSECKAYDLKKIIQVAKEINNSKIELTITPVLIPGINDKDIEDLIKFAKELKCKIAIQKYETYQYSRKLKHAKRITWWKFYKTLTDLEKKYNIKLKFGPLDYNIVRTRKLPLTFQENETTMATIKLPGWQKDQMIAVAKDKCLTVKDCKNKINDKIKVQIIENKNNIYIVRKP